MKLKKLHIKDGQTLQLCGSKSVSNRLLVLRKLFGKLVLENLSNSQDTVVLNEILKHDSADIVDVIHSGTALRLLTSYYAVQNGKRTVITGSEGLKQRPMKPLVDALRLLGAEIEYLGNKGYAPLGIVGTEIEKNLVKIPANISSQFISSLMLIGAKLKNGLTIELEGEITSRPYMDMTYEILKEIGVLVNIYQNTIMILPYSENSRVTMHYDIESDWSSASYFYSMAALGKKEINLKIFKMYSLQGDAVLKEIFWNFFGVNTVSDQNGKIAIIPEKDYEFPKSIEIDMKNFPDIAPTVCITAAALQIPFKINGLATLKIKETDRLAALQRELLKFGVLTEITDESIESVGFTEPNENITVETYGDHRIAMCFAPMSLIYDIEIKNEDVVEKSYPDFWNDFFTITEKDLEN